MTQRKLVARVISGDRRAIARAISLVENRESGASELLRGIRRKAGDSFALGITGPPGTGKSTLVDRLIQQYRKRNLKIGVIAVDPTSPITGGALLGDRIRMLSHATDSGVFIRSMASRGWSGGLSGAVADAIQILDASGSDLIFIETVGIGQADIEIMKIAHGVLVVLMPGMGDDVQVSKAGLMEIGDIYVVNKSDLEGADLMALNLLTMVRQSKGRKPDVLKVSALNDEGVENLVKSIEVLRSRFQSTSGREMRIRSTMGMILEHAKNRLLSDFEGRANKQLSLELAEKVVDHRIDLEDAVERMLGWRNRMG